MLKKLLPMAIIAVSLQAGVHASEVDENAKPAKLAVCLSCHTATGKSTSPIYPNIGGQSETYFKNAVNAYKNGGRSGGTAAIMSAFANQLTDNDIDELATYFAKQNNE